MALMVDQAVEAVDWLVEIDFLGDRQAALADVLRFRDAVWDAGGGVRQADNRWTVAIVVIAASASEAAARGASVARDLRCSFATVSHIEASLIA